MSKAKASSIQAAEKLLSSGIDLYFKNLYSSALEIFERIIAMEKTIPTDMLAQVYRRKGDCLANLGRKSEAMVWLDKALSTLEKDDSYNRCWFLSSKASCLADLGHHLQAVSAYQEAISLCTTREDLEYLKEQCDSVFAEAHLEQDKKLYFEELSEKLAEFKKENKSRIAKEFKGKLILEA